MMLCCMNCIGMARDSIIVNSRSEERHSRWKVGVSGGTALHATSFTTLAGVQTCCTGFSNPDGSSIAVNGSYALARMPFHSELVASVGLRSTSAIFYTAQKELIDYNGDAYLADVGHNLDVRFWGLSISSALTVPIGSYGRVSIGIQSTIPMSTRYEIGEQLLSPQNLVFESGTTSRNMKSGSVSAAKMFFALPIEVGGPLFKIGRGWGIRPLLNASLPLTSATSGESWKTTTIALGLELNRTDTVQLTDTSVIKLEDPPEPVVEQPKTSQMLSLDGGVIDNTTGKAVNTYNLTYSVKRRRLAVLPAVYFDSASSVIPERYRQGSLSLGNADGKGARDIDVNHAILSILAATLKANPAAGVTVTGCHADDGAVADRNELARSRAQNVIEYLTATFGIAPGRFAVRTRGLPERSSSTRTVTGRAENRRVELLLRNSAYELPVQADTVLVQSLDKLAAEAGVTRPETVNSWTLKVVSGDQEIFIKSGRGAPNVSQVIELSEQQKQQIRRAGTVTLRAEVDDREDGKISKQFTLATITSRADDVRPFDEFGIVLFDYNSSKVSKDEEETINELKQRAARADLIQITGTADASGNADYNLKLAEQRALSVVKELGLQPGTFELKSMISDDYPVELPEGRMLGRQVKVVMRAGK